MNKLPFNHRLGINQTKPIENEFPPSGRTALAYLLQDLVNRDYVRYVEEDSWLGKWNILVTELQRTGRQYDFDQAFIQNAFDLSLCLLNQMEWYQVYIFCERLFDRILISQGHFDTDYPDNWVVGDTIDDIKHYFSEELNNILIEENLAYEFTNGGFQRRGRAQTQKSFQRVGTVLSHRSMLRVCDLYNKARKFFDMRPKPDVENCVKEALCALEACLEILTERPASKNFPKVLRDIQGNDIQQVPSPIVEGMIKIHAYRGSGQGVAHAALEGVKVTEIEAELVLNLVASYITYLVDKLPLPTDEIPF